ncbi:MAG: hypothetical protein GY874_00860 [Desulfobacteraceae bacterium]|nr:hypothetical protein [Desulfobacteraceae bacterium]
MLKLQMDAASQKGSWDGLIASYKADQAPVNNYKWVNAVRSLYRPVLTTGLVIITYLLFHNVLAGLAASDSLLLDIFSGSELKEILRYIVYSIVFSTATAVSW